MRTKLWVILMAGIVVSAVAIAKPTGRTIFSFGAGPKYGARPKAGLIADRAGNLYGTTDSGGPAKAGTVYELTPTDSGWKQTILYDFCSVKQCADGNGPVAPLIFDGEGNLYGTTMYGGSDSCFGSGCGVVFELSPANGTWTETVLYALGPYESTYVVPSGLTFDKAGNLYFTCEACGLPNYMGTVSELSPSNGGWVETTLHAFPAFPTDGEEPSGTIIIDEKGNLYGVTGTGGTGPNNIGGIVYELSPAGGAWTETVLYNFCSSANCSDGEAPLAALTPDGRGNLFGTTSYGGTGDSKQCESDTGCGTVFELTPSQSGEWAETVIHSFTGKDGDGAFPDQTVIFDPKGNLYGTTDSIGANGTVFQMVNDNGVWTERYRTFMAPPYHYPNGLLLERGSIYGTTRFGGAHETGAVFQITP